MNLENKLVYASKIPKKQIVFTENLTKCLCSIFYKKLQM